MAFAPILGAIASVAAGVVGYMGAKQAAEANAQAAEYNAKIAERNAIIADQNRVTAVRQSDIDAEDHRRETRRIMASIRTAYGASGIEIAGSPLDVLEDTALERELDTERIRFEGKVRSREGAIQMLGLEEEATLSKMRAQNERTAGRYAAFGSLIGGIGTGLSRLS